MDKRTVVIGQFSPYMTQVFQGCWSPLLRPSYYRDATDVARDLRGWVPPLPAFQRVRRAETGTARRSKGGPETSAAGISGRDHKVLNWRGLLAIWWTVEADPGITCHDHC
jgi:hypothetical protein